MTKYIAILNGTMTHARKVDGVWLVGGDRTGKGDLVSILLTKDGDPAWFTLSGCFLKFSDWACEGDFMG